MVSVSVPIPPVSDPSLSSMSNPPLPPNNNLNMNPSMTDGDAVSLLQTLGMILTPYQDQSNAHLQMQMYMQMQQQLQQMAAVNTINAAHHAHAQAQAAAANQASMGRGMSLSLPGHPQTSNPLLPPSSQHAMSSSASLPFPTNPFTTHNTTPPTRSPESSPHSSDEHISHHSYPSDGSREEDDQHWQQQQQQQQSQSQSQQHGINHINTTHAPVRTREQDHAPALSRQSTVTSTTSSSSGSSHSHSHSHSSTTRMSPSPDAPSSSSSSSTRPTSFHSSSSTSKPTSGSRPSESPLSSESPSQSSPSPPIGNNSRPTFPFLPGLAALAAPQPKKKRNPKKPGLTREQRLHNRKLAHRQIDANRRLRLAAGFAQLQAVVQPNAAQPLSQIQLLRRSSTLMLELTSERERLQQLLQQMTEDRKEREARGPGEGQGPKKVKIKREKHAKQEQQQQQQQIDGGDQVTNDGHQDEHAQDAHLHPDDQRQVRARSISHPTPSSSSAFPTSLSLPTLPSWQDAHGHAAHSTHTTPHPHPHPHPQLNSNYPHDGHMDSSAFVNPLQHPMAFALMQQQGHSLGYPHASNNTSAISQAPSHMHMSMPMPMHMHMAMSMPLAMPMHHPHPHHPQPHHPSHPSAIDSSHMSPFTSPSMSRRSLGTHPVVEADPNASTNSINDHSTS